MTAAALRAGGQGNSALPETKPSSGRRAGAPLCPAPPSHQPHLDGLEGEHAVLPGVEDLQDGGRDAQTRLVPLHLPAGERGSGVRYLPKAAAPLPAPARTRSPYTSFISEELLRRATRDSTLVESGQKQGWSGLRILPSSGIQVSIQVSKKGTSPAGLDSDRITWKGTGLGSAPCPAGTPPGDPHPGEDPPARGARGWGTSTAQRGRHWSAPAQHWFPVCRLRFAPSARDSAGTTAHLQQRPSGRCQQRASPEGLRAWRQGHRALQSTGRSSPTPRALLRLPSTGVGCPTAPGCAAQLAASCERSRGGHELGIPYAASSLQPPDTQGTLFLTKALHICSAAAGQESRSGLGRGLRPQQRAPGTSAGGCPQPGLPLSAPRGRPGSSPHTLIFPSLLHVPGVSVSFHLSAHTDVETGKIFTQPKYRFLREAASSSSARGGLTLSSGSPPPSPGQPEPNRAGSEGQGWEKAGEIGACPERVRQQRSHTVVSKRGGHKSKSSETLTPPFRDFTQADFWLPRGNRAGRFTRTQRGAA